MLKGFIMANSENNSLAATDIGSASCKEDTEKTIASSPHAGKKEPQSNSNSNNKDESGALFQDESEECAICFESLNDTDMEVIELTTCGHRWHLECLRAQLQQAQPNPAQRLVLTGCRCAKCGSVCDHPALRHYTRKTDALREKVDAVLKEQLDISTEAEVAEARRKYAIYLCSHCSEPYFGGTIACADTVDGEVPPEERLCIACAPTRLQQVHCRHPLEHRGFHRWKCRYCCKEATHVCYGTVHFCQNCHDRNSERVAQLQQQKLKQRYRGHDNVDVHNQVEPPATLTAIPCPGGETCPYPRPPGVTHHQNGPSAECEQVYSCAWCQSNPQSTGHAFVEPPGSGNLLQNSNGQNGLRGWKQMNPRSHWRTEQSASPLSQEITTNFVSSFDWCIMMQSVPLHRYVRDPSQVRLEASAKCMGRTDCPSVFLMEVIVVDRRGRLLVRQRTDHLEVPADFWERTSLTVEPTPQAHELLFVVHGKDLRFWEGNFGSKVTDCQVRVLGNREELERVMLSGAGHGRDELLNGLAGE